MNATKKQWVLLTTTLGGLLIAIIAVPNAFRAWGWDRSAQYSELDIDLMAPLIFGIAGVAALAVELLVFVIFLVVPTREESRKRNSLTIANYLATSLSLLGAMVLLSLVFTPMAWFGYGVNVSIARHKAVERKLKALERLPESEAIERLKQIIRTGPGASRVTAANEICRRDAAEQALDDLLDLTFGKYGTNYAGYQVGTYPACLLKLGPKAAPLVPRLARALTEPPGIPEVEWHRVDIPWFAAMMLGTIGPDAKPAIAPLEQMALTYEKTQNLAGAEKARSAAVRALSQIGADCDVCGRLLDSKFGETRLAALNNFREKCRDLFSERIQSLVKDPDPEVRKAALTWCDEFARDKSTEVLVAAAKGDADLWVRLIAFHRIGPEQRDSLEPSVKGNLIRDLGFESRISHNTHTLEQIVTAIYSLDPETGIKTAKEILKRESFAPTQAEMQKFLAAHAESDTSPLQE